MAARNKSVFINYSYQDRNFVYALTKSLRKFFLEVWFYEHGFEEAQTQSLEDMSLRVVSALNSADFVILIISPASLSSAWVSAELAMTLSRERERKVKFLPLLLRPIGFLNDL